MGSIKNRVTERWFDLPNKNKTISDYNFLSMKEDIEYLNNKIDKARKNINAWDFYKISQVVNNESEYQIKINSLLPNTALIIQSSNFIYNDESFKTGDIVYKMPDYTFQHIKAERGGTYYPKLITAGANGSYNIKYAFSAAPPSDDSGTQSAAIGNEISKIAKQIQFNGFSQTEVQGVYGYRFQQTTLDASGYWSKTFSAQKGFNSDSVSADQVILTPTIKYFAATNNDTVFEEVIVDTQISYNSTNNNFTISNIPELVKYIIIK